MTIEYLTIDFTSLIRITFFVSHFSRISKSTTIDWKKNFLSSLNIDFLALVNFCNKKNSKLPFREIEDQTNFPIKYNEDLLDT